MRISDWSSDVCSSDLFCNAFAQRIGDEGRDVATILEMVALTRLECLIGSAAEMRMALTQAVHHARQRREVGRAHVSTPMTNAHLVCRLLLENKQTDT